MTTAFIEGMFLGLTMAMFMGPSFITIIQTSIHRGLYPGFQTAIGVSLSDISLIALSYIGAQQFLTQGSNQLTFGIIGGGILIGFGLWTYNRHQNISSPSNINLNLSTRFLKYFSKGFFLNLFNPFIFIFWLGVMSLMGAKYGIGSREILVFFAGAMGAIFTTDIIKCFVAQRIRRRLNIRVLNLLNKIVGVLLVTFGLILITRVVFFT